jgi:hypothetical protein
MPFGVQRTTPIWLWQVDSSSCPKLLSKVPFPLDRGNDALRSIEKDKFINIGILKYVEFWKLEMSMNDIYIQKMGIHMRYYKNILVALSKPWPLQIPILLEGFWPSNNWRFNHNVLGLAPTIVDEIKPKEPIILDPHCGPKNSDPC